MQYIYIYIRTSGQISRPHTTSYFKESKVSEIWQPFGQIYRLLVEFFYNQIISLVGSSAWFPTWPSLVRNFLHSAGVAMQLMSWSYNDGMVQAACFFSKRFRGVYLSQLHIYKAILYLGWVFVLCCLFWIFWPFGRNIGVLFPTIFTANLIVYPPKPINIGAAKLSIPKGFMFQGRNLFFFGAMLIFQGVHGGPLLDINGVIVPVNGLINYG